MSVRTSNGFAIIEVMVTILILSIGLSGIGVLLLQTIQGTQDTAQHSQAMWLVQDFAGRLRANPEGARASDYVINAGEINCDIQPAMNCADTYQAGAFIPANPACGPAEMSEYDKWISTCGIDDEIYDSPSDFIISPELTSECTLQGTTAKNYKNLTDCVQYQVTLTWVTKQDNVAADADERINENSYEIVVEVN